MKDWKNRMRFFEEDDGGGNGGDDELSKGAAALSTETTTKETVETPTPPATTVDAKELAKSLGAEIAGAMRSQQPAAEPKTIDKLTPEEAEKMLNVWKPSKEWVTKFDNLETREDALKELRDGFIKHSDTITQHRLREALDGVEKKFAPTLEFIQRYENEQAEKRFDLAYPELAKPEYKKVVEAVANDLQKNGKKFDSEKALFDELAKGVEAVFKVQNPNFKLSAGSNPAAKQPKGQNANSIPVTTPGAGGGGGDKGDKPEAKRGLAIFQK